MTILKDLSQEQLIAKILELQANQIGNGIKVSAKGAVSVYGLGRFPLTLYRSQWEALFPKIEDVKIFIAANADKLSNKEGE